MTMTLIEAIDAYITLRRSLGAVFSADTRVLRSFGRAFGDTPVDGIDRQAILGSATTSPGNTRASGRISTRPSTNFGSTPLPSRTRRC